MPASQGYMLLEDSSFEGSFRRTSDNTGAAHLQVERQEGGGHPSFPMHRVRLTRLYR